MSGIYIHIPFCKQACSYCDFYFVTKKNNREAFVSKLIEEIQSKADSVFTQEPVETIYFGGGTPSLLKPKEIQSIFDAIHQIFDLELKEFTVEVNPDDVSAEYLADLAKVGVDRVSMGVQSFDEDLLRFMNRAHNTNEAMQCLELLKNSPIEKFTADLIYGNPNQTVGMLEKDLNILAGFNPPHISAYSLTIEPKTRLGKQLELGRLLPAEDEEVARHFEVVEDLLLEHGIFRYEVSNFAKPGFEAVHNSNYWSHKNYLGFGPGAHSFWWDEDLKKAKRWENEADLKMYLSKKNFSPTGFEHLDLNTLAEERIMLALRTKKGISFAELETRYSYTFSEKQREFIGVCEKEGKLISTAQLLKLTKEGLKIADAITLNLLS